MKVLVDMNLSPRWMGVLGDAGFEAAHWSSLGASNASDSQIMDFAQANGYVVVTHDLDFSAILAATQGKMSSVVQIRAERVSPDAIRAAVIAALRQMADELQKGRAGDGLSRAQALACVAAACPVAAVRTLLWTGTGAVADGPQPPHGWRVKVAARLSRLCGVTSPLHRHRAAGVASCGLTCGGRYASSRRSAC